MYGYSYIANIYTATLASCDQVLFKSVCMYLIIKYSLPNLKENLKKLYFLNK